MQNEDGWEKGIQMDVKGVSPLDVVTTPSRRGYQIFVRDKPFQMQNHVRSLSVSYRIKSVEENGPTIKH